MLSKKKNGLLWGSVLFFAAVALLRAFNIYVTDIAADVAYDGAFVRFLDTLHDLLLLAAYGYSAAIVVFCGCFINGKRAVKAAVLMSAVILSDRVFCLAYDLAVSGINIRETKTLLTAVSWLSLDFLFFLCMYFGTVFISRYKKGATSGDGLSLPLEENRESTEKKLTLPVKKLIVSCSIMTVFQIISQLVICVQFFMEYDDVTVTEKTQMLGDILRIIVEYGGVLTGAALGFCLLFVKLYNKEK